MHPIHDRHFGNTTGTSIAVQFHNGSTVVNGYIVKQLGTARYRVTANGSDMFDIALANSTAAAETLTAGYGTIMIAPYGAAIQNVEKLLSNHALTTQGNNYVWSNAVAASAGEGRLACHGDDTTPAAFSFTATTGAATNTVTTSANATITGITAPAAISVAGTGATYSVDGGAFTNAAGWIVNSAVVRTRVTSSGSANTAVTSTVTVGGVSATYTVTTAP